MNKSKLAIWSWILPIVGITLLIIVSVVSSGMRADAGIGSPITPPERSLALVFSLVFLALVITGFIFGIISLKAIKREPTKLSGKGFAISGIIINAILFFFGVLGLFGSLIGG